jgi:Ca-activated chloride channel family protein
MVGVQYLKRAPRPLATLTLVGLAFAVLSLAVLAAILAPPVQARADGPAPTRVLLLLDVSGSMNSPISSGGTKFAAAKKALKEVAGSLPAGTQVGLRVYGSKISAPKSVDKAACTDTDLVMPIGPLDKAKMYKAVDSFTAKGETPIAYSLQKSVGDLGDTGKRVLVLISDGEETCTKDPCPTARKLASSGVDLQFNAIGLAVKEKARKQLKCIAEVGNGSYYDATRASELTQAVKKITQRALRPFGVTGTPVKGTVDDSQAPLLAAGQYTDSYDSSKTPRYYRIDRTPGTTVTASIASTVRPYQGQSYEAWELLLSTPAGQTCDRGRAAAQTFHSVTVVSGAVRAGDPIVPDSVKTDAACTSGPLLLSLSRGSYAGNTKAAAVEILVQTEAAIANTASLPRGLASYSGKASTVEPSKPVRTVLGGTSFVNADLLTPGSSIDSVALGETVFYRVPLQTGQRLRLTVTAPGPHPVWKLGAAEGMTDVLMIYSPARLQLTRQLAGFTGSNTMAVTAAGPQVRVRNREVPWSPNMPLGASQLSAASVAGDYYVGVQLDPLSSNLIGRVVPVQLDVSVDGKPSGQPVYATPTPTPTPTPTVTPSSPGSASASPAASSSPSSDTTPTVGGKSIIGLVIGGVVLVTALVTGAFWLFRRRSQRP